MGLCFRIQRHILFLRVLSDSIFPTLIQTNPPLIKSQKCDFQLPFMWFLHLIPSPAPCLVLTPCTQPSGPLCSPCGPLRPWEEEAHAGAVTLAHQQGPPGGWLGACGGRGLDLWAMSSGVTRGGTRAKYTEYVTVGYTFPKLPSFDSVQSLQLFLKPNEDTSLSITLQELSFSNSLS